jgi:hypothetical protein
MKKNRQLKDKDSEKKIQLTFFEKMAYPAEYLELKYGVSQIFIYLIFLFFILGIIIFLGM